MIIKFEYFLRCICGSNSTYNIVIGGCFFATFSCMSADMMTGDSSEQGKGPIRGSPFVAAKSAYRFLIAFCKFAILVESTTPK